MLSGQCLFLESVPLGRTIVFWLVAMTIAWEGVICWWSMECIVKEGYHQTYGPTHILSLDCNNKNSLQESIYHKFRRHINDMYILKYIQYWNLSIQNQYTHTYNSLYIYIIYIYYLWTLWKTSSPGIHQWPNLNCLKKRNWRFPPVVPHLVGWRYFLDNPPHTSVPNGSMNGHPPPTPNPQRTTGSIFPPGE